MYNRNVAPELPRSTRGNKYKLENHSFHYNFRKFSFAARVRRVVNVWNSLPDHVVDVNSLKQFETRLDKFWGNQGVMYGFIIYIYLLYIICIILP